MLKLDFPNTKFYGDYSVGLATAYFLGNGYQVLFPFGDRGHYDLVIEKDNIFQTVQCKWTTQASKHGYPELGLQVCGKSSKEHLNGVMKTALRPYPVYRYAIEDFALLWVATPKTCYLIPFQLILQNKEAVASIRLTPKWDKYRVAIPIPYPDENESSIRRASPHLTDDDKAIIKRLLKDGKTQEEIADVLNVTRACVSLQIHRNKAYYRD